MRLNASYYLESLKFSYKVFVFGILFMTKDSIADNINVNTTSGLVSGYESKSGAISFYSFKNIPFAKQPVGDLRFELPEEVDPSEDGNSPGAIYCPQSSSVYTRRLKDGTFGQENCLFMDIYVRKTKNLKTLPVLIYFHAGRFSYGSKEEYGGDFLLNFNEIIIAIPNYRLGILGFLNSQDSLLPGNLGLWDQRMAMKWVHENIGHFGGDPERITISGHDAGGASVGLHILSQLSHGYFTAAISVSGTALDPWVMAHSSENAEIVGKNLKCSSYSKDELKTCLKNRTLSDILEVQAKVGNEMFRPVVDDAANIPFIPFPPQTLYEQGYQKDVSYIGGVSVDEAFVEVNNEFPTAIQTQHLDKIIQHLLAPYLKEMSNLSLIVKAVKYHYLRGVPVPSFDSIRPQMISMMSDYLYNTPLHNTLRLHSRKTSNTFMYVFKDKDEADALGIFPGLESGKNLGMSHIGDAVYVFNTTFPQKIISFHSNKNHFKEIFCNVWGNFIKTRSLSLYDWKKFSEKEMNYVEISETITTKVNYKKSDLELWIILVPDLQKIQNISTVMPNQITSEEKNAVAWGAAGLSILLGVFCIALVGVVVVTRRKLTQSSIISTTAHREQIKYSNIG